MMMKHYSVSFFFKLCLAFQDGVEVVHVAIFFSISELPDQLEAAKLLSLAVKEDLIARNGKFVGYGFSRCEPKQEQLSPFSSSSFFKATSCQKEIHNIEK